MPCLDPPDPPEPVFVCAQCGYVTDEDYFDCDLGLCFGCVEGNRERDNTVRLSNSEHCLTDENKRLRALGELHHAKALVLGCTSFTVGVVRSIQDAINTLDATINAAGTVTTEETMQRR